MDMVRLVHLVAGDEKVAAAECIATNMKKIRKLKLGTIFLHQKVILYKRTTNYDLYILENGYLQNQTELDTIFTRLPVWLSDFGSSSEHQ